MQLNDIRAPKGARKRKRILGRGPGSGRGKTAGRGQDGQSSRAGRSTLMGSEGGQMPLIRRLPKFGFTSHRPILNQVVNVGDLNVFEKDAVITAESLKAKGLIKSLNKPFKILGDGELKKALNFKIKSISKSAREKIEKAGGTMEGVAPLRTFEKKIKKAIEKKEAVEEKESKEVKEVKVAKEDKAKKVVSKEKSDKK